MARVVPFQSSFPQQGAARVLRPRSVFGRVTAVGALLSVLSVVGSVVFAAAKHAESTFVAWAETRRQRQADRKLWSMALADPRLMADLIALQQHADAERK
jgi:predicted transposase YbfD/YdcC